MEHTTAVQLDHHSPNEEETFDDEEVSVANMNRQSDNVATKLEDHEKEGCVDTEYENEEVDSDEEYSYSEDSIYSDDSCRDSDITNVTPRSSVSAGSPLNRTLSLEFPISRRKEEIGRQKEEIERGDSKSARERFENPRENIPRTCSSVNDNRFSINNNRHLRSIKTRSRRLNMSFTNTEIQKIERENQFLLKKIMAHDKPRNKPMRILSAQSKVSSSAINRKKLQKRIEEENVMMLRRMHVVKPCAVSTNTAPGYRVTSL